MSDVIYSINGPVVTVRDSRSFSMREMVYVGEKQLLGEVIRINTERTVIQVYESTTGLRPGEKLYEELLNIKELTKPTHHEKIMIAKVREYDYDEVKERIQHLIEISYTYDQMKIVAAMKDLEPEFISKNSIFESLDKK